MDELESLLQLFIPPMWVDKGLRSCQSYWLLKDVASEGCRHREAALGKDVPQLRTD